MERSGCDAAIAMTKSYLISVSLDALWVRDLDCTGRAHPDASATAGAARRVEFGPGGATQARPEPDRNFAAGIAATSADHILLGQAACAEVCLQLPRWRVSIAAQCQGQAGRQTITAKGACARASKKIDARETACAAPDNAAGTSRDAGVAAGAHLLERRLRQCPGRRQLGHRTGKFPAEKGAPR